MALFLLSTPQHEAQAQYPITPPRPGALRPVRFPAVVQGRLANGLSYVIVEQHEQPVVTVTVALPVGSAHDPSGKEGLAELMADLLTKGTERRSAEQIAAEIEGAGGVVFASADQDYLRVTVSLLAENLEGGLDVLADVLTRSTFPEREVELSRTRAISSLRLELSQPQAIGTRLFLRELYGEHPYGRSRTTASFQAVTRDDLARQYAERVRPGGALVVVAGDVRPSEVRNLLQGALAGWSGAAPGAAGWPEPPSRAGREIVLVNRPGSVQSSVGIGFVSITPRDPAFYPLVIGNHLFGGSGDSRLNKIIREQRGWTYSIRSSFSRPYGRGIWSITTDVRTEVTDSAVGELLRMMDQLRSQGPADSEVVNAKSFLVGSFPRQIETPEQIAGAVANARLLGLPDDYVVRFRDRMAAVTPSQIRSALQRSLTTDRALTVVVGEGLRILDGLKSLGIPLRIVDIEGRPLTEADLRPAAAASLPLAPGRITAGTVTYRVLLQGNPFGEETRTIVRASEQGRDSWRATTTTSLGFIGQQSDTSTVDAATLLPIRVRQGGRLQGQDSYVRLDYEGARVRGQSRTPSRGGPRELTIDTTLSAATFDDNELALLLMALPFQAGARWTFPAFSGGEGTVRSFTVEVTGEEQVTVPAGTFACWKVEVTGGQIPATFYFPKEGPPAFVKLELTGVPIVFELTRRN
jgi:zinc protease